MKHDTSLQQATLNILGTETDLLVRIVHELDKLGSRRIAENLAPANVSATQALFIMYLAYNANEPVYQYTLERTFGLSNPTVTASIQSLIKKGIVHRERDKNDGRYFRIFLTDHGRELYQTCTYAYADADDIYNGALTPDEIAEFKRIARKIIAHRKQLAQGE